MYNAKRFLASILVLAGLALAFPSRAEENVYYLLMDGSKAIIVERQLIVYPTDSKRYFARPGKYQTKDRRYTIVVTPKGATVIQNEPRKDQ
jgi:hypothetical protein